MSIIETPLISANIPAATATNFGSLRTEYKREGPKSLKKAKQIAKNIGYDDAPNVMDNSLIEFAKMSVNLNKE